jgi:hypothetical protein
MIPPIFSPMLMMIPVLTWLAILSYFDIKTRRVPHIAWILIPFLVVWISQIILGRWAMAALSATVIMVSERKHIAIKWQKSLSALALPMIVILIGFADTPCIIISLAIIGFWLAWELHGWGGADAMIAITLVILWPDVLWLVLLLGVNLIAVLVTYVKKPSFEIAKQFLPGIPLITGATIIFILGRMVSRM